MDASPSLGVELQTNNFTLRTLKFSDATGRYVGWLNDPEVNKYLEIRHSKNTRDSVKRYISSHDNKSSFLFGIFDKKSGDHVGNYSARCDLMHLTATLGVMLGDKSYWGRRIILETRARILDFLFGDVGMMKVHGACYSNNLPAIYNYKKQGFTCEAVLKSHRISGKRRVDVLMFSMLRDAWESE